MDQIGKEGKRILLHCILYTSILFESFMVRIYVYLSIHRSIILFSTFLKTKDSMTVMSRDKLNGSNNCFGPRKTCIQTEASLRMSL